MGEVNIMFNVLNADPGRGCLRYSLFYGDLGLEKFIFARCVMWNVEFREVHVCTGFFPQESVL